MKTLLFILIISPIGAFAQLYGNNEIGIINDPDGYTFIREGHGTKTNVIDTLFEGEFFNFTPTDTSNWFKIYKMWNVYGFVHNSRIQNIKDLNNKEQLQLIDSIFDEEIRLHKNYWNNSTKEQKMATKFHEEKFGPTLELFVWYMCKNYDQNLIHKFCEILNLESGSADELPSWALGYIFLCAPDLTINSVKKINSQIVYGHLEFGFSNVTYQKENEIQNYSELKMKIEKITTTNNGEHP